MKKLLIISGLFGMLLSFPCAALTASTVEPVVSQSIWSKTKSLFVKKTTTSVPIKKVVQPVAPAVTKPVVKTVPKPTPAPVKKTAPAPVKTKVTPVVTSTVPTVTPVEPVVSTHTRPATAQVQDLGAYKIVLPEFLTNLSIANAKLLGDGSVWINKNEVEAGQLNYTNYLFQNGIWRRVSDAEMLFTGNAKGDIVRKAVWNGPLYFVSKGKKTIIPSLGGISHEAIDMNEKGQVIGTGTLPKSTKYVDGGESRAYLWSNGKTMNLGTLESDFVSAVAINNEGEIVGNYVDRNNLWRVFLWKNGSMKQVVADGYDIAAAADIADDGTILVKIRERFSDCNNAYCKTDLLVKDNQIKVLDKNINYEALNNRHELVGYLSDQYFGDKIAAKFSSERLVEILNRTSDGCNGKAGIAVVRSDDKTYSLNEIVGDSTINFMCAKSINDRGEVLASGFNYQDAFVHEYVIQLPKQISSGARTIAEETAVKTVNPEPRDPNKIYAQPVLTN